MRGRVVRRTLGLTIMVAVLAACGFLRDDRVDAKDEDVLGVWRNEHYGTMLTLNKDHSFEANDVTAFMRSCNGCLPHKLGEAKLAGNGEWTLGSPLGMDDSQPHNNIHLSVDPPLATISGKTGANLRVERDKSGALMLAYYVGDPDVNNKIIYEKDPGATNSRTAR